MSFVPAIVVDVGGLLAAVLLALAAGAVVARLFIRASDGTPRRERTTTSPRDDGESGSGGR